MRTYRDVYRAADPIEHEMMREFRNAAKKGRDQLSIADLTAAIFRHDIRAGVSLLPLKELQSHLVPLSHTVEETVLRGGRLAAKRLRKATE